MASEVRPKPTKEYGVTFKDPIRDSVDNEISDTRGSYIEPNYPSTSSMNPKSEKYEKEKLGHRRVDEDGQVTYKKKPTTELMAAMMKGIAQSIGGLTSKPERDLLMQDFAVVESVFFPSEGSNLTPAHSLSDFRFKTYAPMAFRYFRELFGIQPDDFLYSMCNDQLVELSNPGASGSVFYITSDDEFIIKTLQHKEAEFLQKLLPGYYMNLNQNPRTLLPKFYGLYCYQCGGKNIRFAVMNNLLPSSIVKHEKYDLKGSTYKRKASKREVAKSSPTLKDLDFMEIHADGISMEADTYNALNKTLQRDGRVLESFKIMDYSLLLAIHNLDIGDLSADGMTKSTSTDSEATRDTVNTENEGPPRSDSNPGDDPKGLSRGRSVKRLANYSTALESIHADSQPNKHHHDNDDIPTGGIPAKNNKGERLLLFIGIIDILQNYRFRKKMEHAVKAFVHDGDTISVTRPSFYASRFLRFFSTVVFKKIPTPLKHSPSKKKSGWGRQRTQSHPHVYDETSSRHGSSRSAPRIHSAIDEQGAIGGRPDLLPAMSTPPPTFEEAVSARDRHQPHGGQAGPRYLTRDQRIDQSDERLSSRDQVDGSHNRYDHTTSSYDQSRPSYTTETRTSNQIVNSPSTEYRKSGGSSREPTSPSSSSYLATTDDVRTHGGQSPVPSQAESTPTHTEYTEGTPSFTTSSASFTSDTLVKPKTYRYYAHHGMMEPMPSTPASRMRTTSTSPQTSSPAFGDYQHQSRQSQSYSSSTTVTMAATSPQHSYVSMETQQQSKSPVAHDEYDQHIVSSPSNIE